MAGSGPAPKVDEIRLLPGRLTLARVKLYHCGCRHGRWLPADNAPDAGPRLLVVGDPREPPAQFDGSGEFALVFKDLADRGSIGFCDKKHTHDDGSACWAPQANSGGSGPNPSAPGAVT